MAPADEAHTHLLPQMKKLVTLGLIIALVFSSIPTQQSRGQDAAATCIVGVIGVAVVGTLVYGLYRMCQAIPAPDQDPPREAPISEIPGIGPPSYLHPLPPLKLRNQLFTSRVSFQHRDLGRSSDWQTDYTFVAAPSQIGGLAMVAYDGNGTPVMTNDVTLTSINGESWASFDFTALPMALTNSPSARAFRLKTE